MRATLKTVLTGLDPFDAASLSTLRTLLARVNPEGEPSLVSLRPTRRGRSMCLIPGSFNPPTIAHVALADRAIGDGFEEVHFVYSVNTVGKRPSGLVPEDRLLLTRSAAPPGVAVSVSNAGLLADLAQAADETYLPSELSLLVGGDKLEQLFDDRWYADKEASLEKLFALSRVVVAPRRDQAERVANLIRTHPRWAPRIEISHLHPSVGEVSSTRVRQILRAGGDPSGLVTEQVASFLSQVGAFSPPASFDGRQVDRYAMRSQLFDLVLDGRCTREVPDLHLLWRLAHDPGRQGKELRAMLMETSNRKSSSIGS